MFCTSSAQLAAGLQVDLDHAGIGSHLEVIEAVVVGRGVAFQPDRERKLVCGLLDRRQQMQIVFDTPQRRHEDVQGSFAGFDADRCAQLAERRFVAGR